jgi:hypothetical protein
MIPEYISKLNNRVSVKIINISAILILVLLSLAILGNSMTKPVSRDEQMYCAGGVCLAQGKMIYRDFSYTAQLPYHPLLYAALFKMFNTTHYLLVGRLVSSVCDILVMVCIFGIFRHIFKSFAITGTLLALAAVVLYLFNPLVDYANGYAWNHDVVILCVVLSFWLFITTDFQGKSRCWRIAAIGALLTFATFMRITTALVGLLFFVMLLSQPAESIKQRFKTVLPFLIAAAFVSIWPVWVIAQAPQAFFLNVVKIPTLNGQWLHKIGMARNKFGLTMHCFVQPGYFVLLVLAIYLCLTVIFLRRRLKIVYAGNLLFAALLLITFFIIALIPPTMWRQYLAMPFIISFAYPLLYLRKLGGKHLKIASVLVAFFVFMAVYWYPIVLQRVPMVLVPERWEPFELHKLSEDIAEKSKEPKLILTLAPLLALEGGCDIYPELSAGAFLYRIAGLMSPEDRAITRTVSPEELDSLIQKSPPSAVIIGVEPRYFTFLEEPLFKQAVRPDWERKIYDNGPTVYFRP